MYKIRLRLKISHSIRNNDNNLTILHNKNFGNNDNNLFLENISWITMVIIEFLESNSWIRMVLI